MDRGRLVQSINIADVEVPIDADFRNIIDIFEIFNDPNLLDYEKSYLALSYFYLNDDYLKDPEQAGKELVSFINMGSDENSTTNNTNQKPLYDWDQDFDIICSAVNRVLGYDCRGKKFLHWWTFLAAFMEIGDCTFSTYVSIRNKKNKGKKLEKWEQKIYNENKDKILLKKRVDDTTQQLMNEIMGKG